MQRIEVEPSALRPEGQEPIDGRDASEQHADPDVTCLLVPARVGFDTDRGPKFVMSKQVLCFTGGLSSESL